VENKHKFPSKRWIGQIRVGQIRGTSHLFKVEFCVPDPCMQPRDAVVGDAVGGISMLKDTHRLSLPVACFQHYRVNEHKASSNKKG